MDLNAIKQNSKYLMGLLVLPMALAGAISVFSDAWIAEPGDFSNSGLKVIDGTTLISNLGNPFKVLRVNNVIVTAYSSSVWETQGDPFITASGARVRDGIVANNLLAFGTLVRMPELFGDKIFTVTDRMHSRKGDYHIDVWFPSREEALEFGAKTTKMEILVR